MTGESRVQEAMVRKGALALAVAALAVAGLPARGVPVPSTVHIAASSYLPPVAVTQGDPITFKNIDSVGGVYLTHTASYPVNCTGTGGSLPCEWDTGFILVGSPVTVTVATPGEYVYYCRIHEFKGALVVAPAV